MKKNPLIAILASVLFLFSCSQGQGQALDVTQFADKIKTVDNAQIVDVRTPDEYNKGHLENAVNIDWNNSNFENEISKLDKSKPIFVYCLSGGRSSSATNKMHQLGFKEIYEMNGGIMKWQAKNLPLTQESNSSQSVANTITEAQYNKLINSDKTVIVDFYADWCKPCKMMKPHLEEIEKEMSDKVQVVRINADNNEDLCRAMAVEALPTIFIYKNGKMMWQNVGYTDKSTLVSKL